ncbi:MAG: aldose epimerase family protein [Pseudomonadota bacterium]
MADDLQSTVGRDSRIEALLPLAIDGQAIPQFRLRDASGLAVDVLALGATVTQVWLPGADGPIPITCGPDQNALAAGNPKYLGSTIGRVSNRIRAGQMSLDGQRYQLTRNLGDDHLHGGEPGFHRKHWQAGVDGKDLHLRCFSPDGEAGYPGAVDCHARFRVADQALEIELEASVADKPTPLSLTNHCYWRLGPEPVIDNHELCINADRVLAVDAGLLPTGETRPLIPGAAPPDLRVPAPIRDRVIDDCYLLDACAAMPSEDLSLAARLRHPGTGRSLALYTDHPALQCYTGHNLDGSTADAGHAARAGLCLEPQQYPDAVNQPSFPSCLIAPGNTYRHRLRLRFDWPTAPATET